MYETIARKTTTLANIGRIRNESTPSHPKNKHHHTIHMDKKNCLEEEDKKILFFQRTFVQTNQGHHFAIDGVERSHRHHNVVHHLEQRGAHGAGRGDKHHLQIMSVGENIIVCQEKMRKK